MRDDGGNILRVAHQTGAPYYSFTVYGGKHTLVHQTVCTATGNTNNERMTIGIGEQVAIYLDPALNMTFPETPFWTALGAGSVSSETSSGTTLTASLSPGAATVKVQVRDVSIPITFSVIAPSGMSVTFNKDLPLGTPGPPNNQIGASSLFNVQIVPTSVSFVNVPMRENISPAVTNTWPNRRKFYVLQTNDWGFAGYCLPSFPDTISELLHPISYLYNGTNYESFSYTLNYHNEYQNQSGHWIPFVSVQTTTIYQTNGSCQEIYQGVPGGSQGPWQ
jgi:hypothetical protein